MTKAQITESVFINLGGGRIGADIDTKRTDIVALVDAAIALVLQQFVDEGRRRDVERLQLTGAPEGGSNALYAITHTLTPVEDSTRGLYKIELPGKLIRLTGQEGIEMVAPIKGRTVYTQIMSQADLVGLPDNIGMVYYWVESISNSDVLWLDGIGLPVCDHLVKMLLLPEGFNDEQELPLPSGVDLQVVDMLVRHFSGQTLFPQDQQITDTDERSSARTQTS